MKTFICSKCGGTPCTISQPEGRRQRPQMCYVDETGKMTSCKWEFRKNLIVVELKE